MKKRLQKTLAMLLSLSMVFSLSITAFAEEAPAGAIYEDQVCDYLAYDSTGTPGEATNEYVKSIENGDITMEKSIVQTGEDAFDITLEVTTKQDLSLIKVDPDAAVCLIFDVSGSMLYCDECGAGSFANPTSGLVGVHKNSCSQSGTLTYETSRMVNAIAATQDFIESFGASSTGGKRMVSVVFFAKDAILAKEWTDAADTEGRAELLDVIASAKDRADSWTSQDGGMRMADYLFDSADIADIGNRYAILLTDGIPTAHAVSNYNAANGVIAGISNQQNVKTLEKCKEAGISNQQNVKTLEKCKEAATALKDNGKVELYAMAYAAGAENVPDKRTIADWLKEDIATGASYYKDASNGENVKLSFAAITESVIKGMSLYTVTDPMGDHINYVDLTGENENVVFENNTLKWNLLDETPVVTGKGSSKLYTYTLSYSITLDKTATGGVVYPTNKATFLKYLATQDLEGDGEIDENKVKFDYFNVPQVTKGKSHNAITMLEDDKKTEVPVGYQGEALVTDLEGGTMTAQKWGTFATAADAEQGIVNVSFDVAGEALEVPGPLDLIVIADESGSLNMYGRADVKANANSPTTSASYMPCLNKDHYYMVKGLQYELNQIAELRGLAIPAGTENAAADAATFITPHGVSDANVDLAYTVFGHWGKYPALVRTMIAKAGVVIPEGMTDADVFRALFSDWDSVALNSKGALTFTNLVGWTPDKNHYHKADIDSEIPYVENNETVAETGEPYSYWSPAADNAYGCYDRMMIEKEGVASLVDKIYGQHWDNRVAYVGFTYSAYPSLSSNNIEGADSGFCAATNINYAAGGDAPAALMEVINNTSGHDYTNYAHALWAAKKMIDDRADKTRPVYVVFISDGVPTRTSSATANTWNILEAPVQGGSDGDCLGFNEIYYGETDYTHETAAMYVAAQFRKFLKETVAEYEFYTVGFNTNASADALLDDMDNNGFKDCTDATDFLAKMEGIRQDIIMVDPDGVLYDEIGADFDFIIDEQHPLIVTAKEYNAENAKWELTTVTYTTLEAAEADDRLTFTYVDGKVTAISVALEDVTTAEVSFYEQLKPELLKPVATYNIPYVANYYETNETDATLTYHKLVLDKTSAIGYKAEENATVVEMLTPWVKVEGYYQSIEDINVGTSLADILAAYRNPVVNAVTVLCDCDPEHDCCDHTEEVLSAAVFSLARSAPATEETDEDEIVEVKGKNNDKGQLKHNAQNNTNGDKHVDCDHKHHKGDCEDEFEGVIVCKCKCKECHQNKFDAPDKKDDAPGKKENKDIGDKADKGETGKKTEKKR